MIQNPYLQGKPDGRSKTKLLLLAASVLIAVVIATLLVHSSRPKEQDKYVRSATAAAREHIPNAEVANVRVAGGFALAIVSDPDTGGQANAGNTTVFKVNSDGSMKQLANGSYFGPLDLLGLGIPLTTQAKLTESNLYQVKQDLANQCGYDNSDTPGFSGFSGSFSPNDWQIDTGTLDSIEQKLSSTVSGKAIICINATRNSSNMVTNATTYVSTFTLQLQFITDIALITTHTFTFTNGPVYSRNYTLDGQSI